MNVKDFYDWCSTQSGDYDYNNVRLCPFAQYLKYCGNSRVLVGSDSYYINNGKWVEYDLPALVGSALSAHPRTFEALTERLEAQLASAEYLAPNT